MPFLPQELCSPKEWSGTHLPAHDIGPLVDQERKVTVGVDPLPIHMPDDGLGGRPDHQGLLELGRRIGLDATAFF